MTCPDPRCRNNGMSYFGSREGREFYRCPRCGCEKVVITRNSDTLRQGSYIMNGSVAKLDRNIRS